MRWSDTFGAKMAESYDGERIRRYLRGREPRCYQMPSHLKGGAVARRQLSGNRLPPQLCGGGQLPVALRGQVQISIRKMAGLCSDCTPQDTGPAVGRGPTDSTYRVISSLGDG